MLDRDILLKKGVMVRRDKMFRKSIKKANKTGKYVDKKIQNIGTVEELQKLADEIYNINICDVIKENTKETIRQRYGGYKIESIDMSKLASQNKIRESSKVK